MDSKTPIPDKKTTSAETVKTAEKKASPSAAAKSEIPAKKAVDGIPAKKVKASAKTESVPSSAKSVPAEKTGTADKKAPPKKADASVKKDTKDKKASGKDAGLTAEEKKLREEQRKRAAKKKRKKFFKTLIILLILFAIAAVVFLKFLEIKKTREAENTVVTYTVSRRTITEKLSATGTLEPVDSYTVTAKVRGDITEANFEEGDEVKKDDILYVIDSGDMDSTVRQREISLGNAQENRDDLIEDRNELTSYSDLTGTILDLHVKVGDTIQKGALVADVVDKDNMLIDIPFHASHAEMMSVGTSLTVIIDGSGERLPGTVTEIATVKGTNAYGAPTKDVTIMVKNAGGISKDTKATAEYTADIAGTDMGIFYYNVEDQLTSEYGGKILKLYIKEGGTVKDGQKIIDFDGKDLEKQIKNAEENVETAQMSYDDTLDSLDDYKIKAPITGTVVEKNFNVGESIDVTSGNAVVAIIYDLSALTFDMNIDELDIFSVKKGQEVTVTSEAFDNVFYGEITKISKVGTTANGTTSYPVTVTITDPEALSILLPGMNIDAEITVNRVENVIAIPTGAVARGNTVKVVKNPDAVKAEQEKQAKENTNKDNGEKSGATDGANGQERPLRDTAAFAGKAPNVQPARPDGTAANTPSAGMPMPATPSTEDTSASQNSASMSPDISGTSAQTQRLPREEVQAPATYGSAPGDTEFETIKVVTGASDDDFIEITSGLEEGDIIIIDKNQASRGTNMQMPMGGMGGGMPAGGMGGGNPGGGNRNMGGGMAGGR